MALNASGSAPGGGALFSRRARRGMQSSPAFQEQSAHSNPFAEARQQAAAEAHLLRTAGTPTSAQRRIILSDLASRLDALLRQLGSEAEALQELVTALTAIETTHLGDTELEALWQQALRVLDEFAGPATPVKAPTRDFWKRT
jgi:Ca-activated chloride channel family protein